MRPRHRWWQAVAALLLVGLCQCKKAPAPAPRAAPKKASELPNMLPAQVAALWAPDFERGLESVTGFVSAVTEPNVWGRFDNFKTRTGVDLQTVEGWRALGIDTGEGVALLVDGPGPPTLVMKSLDTVRLDKFINLYADTREDTDGHAIGNVHNTTVHSYRGVHWCHPGGYTWLTVGRSGRLAMDHMLQHLRRENGKVAPDHPMTADGNFTEDMNRIGSPAWVGHWRGPQGPGMDLGPWVFGFDPSAKGISARLFMAGNAAPMPADATPLDQLIHRYSPQDIMFAATRLVDFNTTRPAPSPTPVAPRNRRMSPHGPKTPQNLGTDPIELVDRFMAQATGLHWSTEVMPDVRGLTWGIGFAGADALSIANLEASVTIDAADAGRAAGWLARIAQSGARINMNFKRADEPAGNQTATTYRADYKFAAVPALGDLQMTLGMAQIGKTVVLTLGRETLDQKLRVLVDPAVPGAAWLTQAAWTSRGANAQGYSVARLASIGDLLAKGPDRSPVLAAGAGPAPTGVAGSAAAAVSGMGTLPSGVVTPDGADAPEALDPNAWAKGGRLLRRLGDLVGTSTEIPGGRLIEWSSDFSVLPVPTPLPALKSPPMDVPVLGPNPGRVWLHTGRGRTSFVDHARYSEKIYLSQPDSVRACRKACWSNAHCLGFFEQTKLCPEPRRNDHKSDPTRSRGRGCTRVCGFFTEGQNPLEGTVSEGAPGTVWLKSDLFGKAASPDKWFGQKPTQTRGP